MNPKLLDRVVLKLAGVALAAALALAVPSATLGQAQGAITPNYKDADLRQIIEAVSEVTGKNFIVDPRVRAQVTMLSSTPMSPDAFYEAFLSILQVHGFVAVPVGRRRQDPAGRQRAAGAGRTTCRAASARPPTRSSPRSSACRT